jgi:hypothetical protein
MFIIALTNANLYLKLKKVPLLGDFFTLKITSIGQLGARELSDFISDIYLPNKTFLMTQEGRFEEIDDITVKYLEGNPENIIHDIAVSCGVTSLDLFNKMNGKVNFNLFISEKNSELFLKGRHICRVYDGEDNLLWGYFFFLFASDQAAWKFPLTKILYKFIDHLPDAGRAKTVSIFDKRMEALLKKKRIKKIQYDIFNTVLAQKFSYIRCMNLLNLCYFSSDQLFSAVKRMISSLKEDGILQIGRTDVETGKNRVSFLRKKNGKLVIMKEVNGGTEIMRIISSLVKP